MGGRLRWPSRDPGIMALVAGSQGCMGVSSEGVGGIHDEGEGPGTVAV